MARQANGPQSPPGVPPEPDRQWRVTPELLLVLVLLFILTLLFGLVYVWPLGTRSTEDLDFRRDVISLLLAAFGGWIGAGAAFFFGRENFKEAAGHIVAMRGPTGDEVLRSLGLQTLNPRPLPFIVGPDDTVAAAVDALRAKPDRWFVAVVRPDGTLGDVITKETLFDHVARQVEAGTAYQAIVDATVGSAVADIATVPGYRRPYVVVPIDRTAADTDDLMEAEAVRLAIITEGGKATRFITTGDIRRALMR